MVKIWPTEEKVRYRRVTSRRNDYLVSLSNYHGLHGELQAIIVLDFRFVQLLNHTGYVERY